MSPPASNAAHASTRALRLASLLFAVVVSGGCEAPPVPATEDAAVTDRIASEDAADADAVDAGEDTPTDARDAAASEAVVAPDVAPDVADACGPDRCGGACVDLQRDERFCGSCERDCTRLPHLQVGGAACAAGACVVRLGGCLVSHGDCDRDPANGCEADLREDEAHCGACGIACPSRHTCYRGMCAPTCVTGETPCSGRCVTLATDPSNCGACGAACPAPSHASPTCAAGACGFACEAGFGDCDRDASNGCEVDLRGDVAHCGACGALCPAGAGRGAICVESRCALRCPPERGDCDGDAANGCEVDTRLDHQHCGACGRACADGLMCLLGRCLVFPVRPTAPIAAAVVTSARPWLRWALPAGADGARVEVCAARDCATTEATWAASGTRTRPPTALRPGVHHWRLYGRRGSTYDAAPGPVWSFVVPPAPQGLRAPLADFNGDGVEDVAVIVEPGSLRGERAWAISVQLSGAAPTTERIPADPVTFGGGVALGVGALGDVDGDGLGELWLDHITVDRTTFSFLPGISVYRGGRSLRTLPTLLFSGVAGDGGTFASVLGPYPVGDLDGDGFGDVLAYQPRREGSFATYHGPRFQVRLGRPGGPGASDLLPGIFDCTATIVGRGDFDADGFTDLVMRRCQADTSLTLAIVLGGTSVAATLVDLPRCGAEPLSGLTATSAAIVHDLDDDGYDDLRLDSGHTFRGGAEGLVASRCARGAPSPLP